MLKGLMLGNPVIGCASVNPQFVTFNTLYYHALVSYENQASWLSNDCNDKTSVRCEATLASAVKQVGRIVQELAIIDPATNQPSLDPDDLYQDFCTNNGTLEFAKSINVGCDSDPSTAYLNRKDVQAAIFANPTTWDGCSDKIAYTSNAGSMIPYYQKIFAQKPGIHVLVYSGDVDIMTVPHGLTQACLAELQLTPNKEWTAWFVNGATAGYWEQFDNFTYATVKGAGHEVPTYQPLTGLNLFSRFLLNQSLDDPVAEVHINNIRQPIVSQGDMLRRLMKAMNGGL
jgi:serine carboxypeptidase-like clade 2